MHLSGEWRLASRGITKVLVEIQVAAGKLRSGGLKMPCQIQVAAGRLRPGGVKMSCG